MLPVETIAAKRDGGALSSADIAAFVSDYMSGRIGDAQMAAFLMAVLLRGMTPAETAALTDAMVASGTAVDWSGDSVVPVDKHSTGGVGDKVSLVLAPLVAACGGRVPMISGRGLGHTGGTLDKLESIPGFRTGLSLDKLVEQTGRIGVCMIGATDSLAPADRRMYALRDVTATVESIPLITASILSKKLAAGLSGIVFDVTCGSGAFMKTRARARELAGSLIRVARKSGVKAVAVITAMDQVRGRAVGNAIEVREAIETLAGGGPEDLREVVFALASHMLVFDGVSRTTAAARRLLDAAIADGGALARFREMVEAQGGDGSVVSDPSKLRVAPEAATVAATRSGYLARLDAYEVGMAGVELGAGRVVSTDEVDPSCGFVVHARVGDRMKRGQVLVSVHTDVKERAEAATNRLRRAVKISPRPIRRKRVIIETVR